VGLCEGEDLFRGDWLGSNVRLGVEILDGWRLL
jgi:hypothetical protein